MPRSNHSKYWRTTLLILDSTKRNMDLELDSDHEANSGLENNDNNDVFNTDQLAQKFYSLVLMTTPILKASGLLRKTLI